MTLDKYGLGYESHNVALDPVAMSQMQARSRQSHVPCVEIEGVMLADTTGQEVEDYLLSRQLVGPAFLRGQLEASPAYIPGVGLSDTRRVF